MRNATIDVIIPLYNVERYIGEAVRSVLAQTHAAQQLIVVDDGSTDKGAEVVRAIQRENTSPTPVVLLRKPNGGLSSARNFGIQHSRADLVAFLDADDRWEPGKLEAQVECFAQDTSGELVLVYCGTHDIDAEGATIPGTRMPTEEPLRGRVFEQLLFANRITGSGSAVLIKRTSLDRAGLFDEQLTALEDQDLWLRISRTGTVDLVNEDLVALRRHSTNMQKNAAHMLRNMLRFYAKWFNEAKGNATLCHYWGHLIAEFALKCGNADEAVRLADATLSSTMKQAYFSRTFGSLRAHMGLKRAHYAMNKLLKRP